MALRDALQGEAKDEAFAATAARLGVSLTGLSGRHQGIDDSAFGAPQAPAPEQTPLLTEVPPEERGPALQTGRSRSAAMKRQRTPFGGQEQRTAYPKRPGYRHYWFNDVPGRLRRAEAAGYSRVNDEVTGHPVMIISGRQSNGLELRSYLYEIPMQWYVEDMSIQQDARERMLNDIRKGRSGPGADDNRYIPERHGGIKFGNQRTA